MTTPTTNQQATNYIWAQTVLTDAGLPTTDNNVLNITRWMVSEEPASNWFHNNNPLNINAGGSGSDSFSSLNASAAATANYLKMSNYTGIYQALANNAGWSTFSAAVVASPWAASHYGGHLFSGTPATVVSSGQTIAPGTPGSGASGTASVAGVGCSAKGGGINLDAASSIPVVGSILPSVTLGNACQLKALTGGLMVGGGFVILVIGALMIAGKSASGTRAGKTAVGYVTGGPAGALAGATTDSQAVVGRTTRAGTVSDEQAQAVAERRASRATQNLAKKQETDARVARTVQLQREAREHKGRRVPASSSGPAF